MQSRRGSLIESIVNTAVGFVISLAATYTVLPAFGLPVSPSDGFAISTIFTVISIVRGYLLRRCFNWLHRPAGVCQTPD